MITFREFFLLSEQPAVVFDNPTPIIVDIDGKSKKFTVDMIDVRAEDWSTTQIRTDQGVIIQAPPKMISSFMPFSLPLADGSFINKSPFGAEVGPEATTNTIVRKDWAKYAEFLLKDKPVKMPMVQRSTDQTVAG